MGILKTTSAYLASSDLPARLVKNQGSRKAVRPVAKPFFPTRTVVGALLEFQGAWQALERVMAQPPHLRPPVHPVRHIKPANTWARHGDRVLLPPDVAAVEVGATLGLSVARAASRVSAARANPSV